MPVAISPVCSVPDTTWSGHLYSPQPCPALGGGCIPVPVVISPVCSVPGTVWGVDIYPP